MAETDADRERDRGAEAGAGRPAICPAGLRADWPRGLLRDVRAREIARELVALRRAPLRNAVVLWFECASQEVAVAEQTDAQRGVDPSRRSCRLVATRAGN